MSPPGKTSLVAEYFVTSGDPLSSMSDDELARLTVRHLAGSLGLIQAHEVADVVVFRARNVYPIYGLDYHVHLKTVTSYLSRFANLQILGRGGTFRYNNADHSVEMGLLAARNVLGERHSLEQVNRADEYLEEKRVSA
jgi:protoporphyrinogen oxidase